MADSTTRDQLSIALEHARRAVNIDKEGIDMAAAIIAYGQSLFVLGRVIQELQRELDASPERKEQLESDIMKIVGIHKSYQDRMVALSEATGIPLPPGDMRSLL